MKQNVTPLIKSMLRKTSYNDSLLVFSMCGYFNSYFTRGKQTQFSEWQWDAKLLDFQSGQGCFVLLPDSPALQPTPHFSHSLRIHTDLPPAIELRKLKLTAKFASLLTLSHSSSGLATQISETLVLSQII
jgi:hypothetical protein